MSVLLRFYKTACMPSTDHRVLTSVGFLYLEEIEARIAAGEAVLYASYDPTSQTLAYATGRPIIAEAPARYVEFVQAATRAQWDGTCGPQASGQRKASHVSLRVTADHDMFVQLGNSTKCGDLLQFTERTMGGAILPYAKVKALDLVPGHAEFNGMRLLCAPPAGLQAPGLAVGDGDGPVDALHLRTDAEIDAFVELYGYWLGDGTLSYRRDTGGTDCVKFCTIKDADWLVARFRRLGLADGTDYRHWTGRARLPVHEIELRTPRWFKYFDEEYWLKYAPGRARRTSTATPARPAATATAVAAVSSSSSSSSPRRFGFELTNAADDEVKPPPVKKACTVASVRAANQQEEEEEDDGEEGAGDEEAAARGGLEDEPDVLGYTALTDPSAAASSRREELRLLGIVPPDVKSAKWFWWWVLRRLNAHQMRLLIEGLRIADGRSAAGGAVIYTSSVNFRDALLQAYLHAGYSGHIHVNTPAGPRQAWLKMPHDGRVYSREEMEAVLDDEPSASFRQLVTRVTSWSVHFSTLVSRVHHVSDVRFDGGAANTISTHSRGFVALKGAQVLRLGGPAMAQRLSVSVHLLRQLVRAQHPTHCTKGWRVWKADAYDATQAATARTTTASPSFDAVSDGRTWCVQLDAAHPRDKERLIVVQRAIRDASGQVVRASRPTVVGNCIRELLPRLYVDMTLLRCYRFILPHERLLAHIARLGRMMRGIGDPLIALYARCYLAAKTGDVYMSYHTDSAKAGEARRVPAEYQPVLLETWADHLQLLRGVGGAAGGAAVGVREELQALMLPGLEYLTQCICHEAGKELFTSMFTLWKEHSNSSLVLCLLLQQFDPQLVSRHALNLLTLIAGIAPSTNTALPPHRLYLALGQALLLSPPADKHRLAILNEAWKAVTRLESAAEYLSVAELWLQFVLRHFSDREVGIFLRDVVKHCKAGGLREAAVQDGVAAIVRHIVGLSADLRKVLTMDSFLLLVDVLEQRAKVGVARAVLQSWARHGFPTADPVILHTLLDLSRLLHDGVDSLTFEDERRQIAQLIIAVVRRIDCGRDLEQQLTQYVDCRQAFTNLDAVTVELVQRVALLASKAHFLMKGRHSKKTAAFVRACLAYMHITIPSLDELLARLRLFLLAAQVALVNHQIVQAEVSLKAAISLLPDVPSHSLINAQQLSTEEALVSFIRSFSSFLLLFPGHPEHGPFYLVRGLLNAVQQCQAWKGDDAQSQSLGKARVLLGLLSLLLAYAQRDFPYHIAEVESNDTLYASAPAYLAELQPLLDGLLSSLMTTLLALAERTDLMGRKHCGTLALDLINLLLSGLQMDDRSGALLVRLFGIVRTAAAALDAAYLRETRRHLQSRRGLVYEEIDNRLRQQDTPAAAAALPQAPTAAAPSSSQAQPQIPTSSTASPLSAAASKQPAASPAATSTNGRPAPAAGSDPFQIRVTAGPAAASAAPRTKGVQGPL